MVATCYNNRLNNSGNQTERLKSSRDAMGAEMLTKAASWTPSTLLSVGARLMTRAYPFNPDHER